MERKEKNGYKKIKEERGKEGEEKARATAESGESKKKNGKNEQEQEPRKAKIEDNRGVESAVKEEKVFINRRRRSNERSGIERKHEKQSEWLGGTMK